MSGRIPLVVELCAGSAAVTLRLIGGPNARPPISYMGSKRGYAEAILNVLGLRSGQGADAVVLVEAGPWARAWRLLTTPEGCRAVADVIRGWVGEDARALWDRLRAEPVPEDAAEAVGAWCYLAANSYRKGDPGSGFDDAMERVAKGTKWGADTRGTAVDACAALAALSWPPVQVIEGDVCGVEPRSVARWLWVTGHGDYSKPPRLAGPWSGNPRNVFSTPRPGWIARRIDSAPAWPPTVVAQADVGRVQPGVLPEGTVVYMDPPYAKTTGYAHDLPREKVLEVARLWAEAGATVCVSEAEPLPLDGWHHVEITDCRVGQKRTFSKQKREWLTLNREPAWRPGVQRTLL